MKVGIIGITENNFIRGVERYTLELVRYLAKVYPEIQVYLLRGKWQEYYDDLSKFGNVTLITVENLRNSKFDRHFFIAFKLFDFIKRLGLSLDVIHYNNTLPILKKTPIPSVITIHDIAEFFVPEKYTLIQRIYRKNMVKISANNADLIITVSNFSAQSLIDRLCIPKEKIQVTYLGIEHFKEKLVNLNKSSADDIGVEDFILYWSVIEHSKGVIETVKAFNLLNKKYPYLKLLVIGKKGNAYRDFLNLIRGNKNIKYLGYVEDEKLINYIRNAKMVVFPSKYEGFGFPPLEAFLLNDNIITSNVTSLAEITSDFALQIDPSNVQELALAIEKLLFRPRFFSKEEKDKILSRFSWFETAIGTYKVYEKLIFSKQQREGFKRCRENSGTS